jgi:signal transduction histidine kinase
MNFSDKKQFGWFLIFISFFCICSKPVKAQLEQSKLSIDINDHADTFLINRVLTNASKIETIHPDSANKLYNYCLQKSRNIGYVYGQADSYRGLGNIAVFKNFFFEAQAYFLKSITMISKDSLLVYMLPQLYNNLGVVKDEMGEYTEAINMYNNGIKYKEVAGHKSKIEETSMMLNIASTLFKLKEYKKAEYYIKLVQIEALKKEDDELLCSIYNNIGSVFAQQNMLDSGMIYFKKSLELNNKKKYNNVNASLNIATILYLKEDYTVADSILSLVLLDSTINLKTFVTIIKLKGQIAYQLKDFRKAEQLLLSALEKSSEMKTASQLLEINLFLYKLYKDEGNLNKALTFYEQYHTLKDSFINRDVLNRSNVLESKIRSAEKDKALAEKNVTILKQKASLKNNRFVFLIAFLICVVAVFTIILVKVSGDRRNEKLKQKLISIQQNEQLVKQREELEVLKATIVGEERERSRLARELHDGIGGMLAAIRMGASMIAEQNVEIEPSMIKLREMIALTADEVRKSAHNLVPDILIRNGLEKALEIYCDRIVEKDTIELILDFQGGPIELSKSSELIIYRMAQELIQNISKHAKASEASLLIKKFNDTLSIIVEDNGIGFEDTKTYNGMGLQNLRYRVQALEGEIFISSGTGRGTTVHVQFNLDKLQQFS